jgi:hypothetical protein
MLEAEKVKYEESIADKDSEMLRLREYVDKLESEK